MMPDAIDEVARCCAEARAALGSAGSFRLRVLLDMVSIEAGLEAARRSGAGETAPPPRDEGDERRD